MEVFRHGRVVASTETKPSGQFEILDLGEGDYNVRVSAPGYQTYEQDVHFSFPDRTRIRLNVYLTAESTLAAPTAYDLALEAAGRGESLEAIKHYKAAISESPGFVPAWHNLGAEYLRLERYREALDALKKAASLGPDEGRIQHGIGRAYYGLGQWAEALSHFTGAAEQLEEGKRGINHFYLGMTLLRLGQAKEAEAHLKGALEVDPVAFVRAHLSLAFLYLGPLEDSEAALVHLESFLKAHPDDPLAPQIRQKIHEIEFSERTPN